MLVQIALEYHALPDPRTLKMHEIRFWYDGIRRGLKEVAIQRQKLKQKGKR
jgi:hypothetical protein